MSLTLLRLVATIFLAVHGMFIPGWATTAAGADNVWTAAGALPEPLESPVFALASDPADGRRVLAGGAGGAIYLSQNGGSSWRPVRGRSGHSVLTLAFDPAHTGRLYAGTRAQGIWRSTDGGLTWVPQPGSEGRTVRAFAFVSGAVLAASDEGVLSTRDGASWSNSGLPQVRISALAVLTASDATPAGVVFAGADSTQGSEPLPLFSSTDGGETWEAVSVTGPAGVIGGSSTVATLAAGPAPGHGAQPLLLGTNAGLFMTADRGASWLQLSGGGTLPATDFSSLAVAPRQAERLYVASDGGGSDQGGLWVSPDGGVHFASLAPPLPEVTALAVTADVTPTLLVATFRPADHSVAVWTYRDAGGPPQGPAPAAQAQPSAAPAHSAGSSRVGTPRWLSLALQPEAPYLAGGVAALLVLLLAAVAYLRRGRQL